MQTPAQQQHLQQGHLPPQPSQPLSLRQTPHITTPASGDAAGDDPAQLLGQLRQLQDRWRQHGGGTAALRSPAAAAVPELGDIRRGAAALQSQIENTHTEMRDFLSAEMTKLSAAIGHSQQAKAAAVAASSVAAAAAPQQRGVRKPVWEAGSSGGGVGVGGGVEGSATVLDGTRLLRESLADIEKADRAMHYAEALAVLQPAALVRVLAEFVPAHLRQGLEQTWRAVVAQYQKKARERLHAREALVHQHLQLPQQQLQAQQQQRQQLQLQQQVQQARGGGGGVQADTPLSASIAMKRTSPPRTLSPPHRGYASGGMG